MSERAVLYARISGDENGEVSKLETQLADCRRFANKKDYTILHEFQEDTYSSGADLDLPHLNEVLELARGGAFEVLVCRELDRLARGLAKQLFIEEELKRSGVQIEYVLEKYDDTPEGGLMKHVKASVAEYERIKIAQRTRRGKRSSVKAGNITCCGLPPYGYREVTTEGDKRGLAIKPAEAAVVKDIFEMYVSDGSIGAHAIAKRLNARRIPSPYRVPYKRPELRSVWSHPTVYRMLRNETYRGKWQFGKKKVEPITVQVPAIINTELWSAARAKAEVRRQPRSAAIDYPFLLRDLAYCANCGEPMRCKAERRATKNGKNHHLFYYVCSKARHSQVHSRNCDHTRSYRADAVDADLWEDIKKIVSDPVVLGRAFQQYKTSLEKSDNPVRGKIEAKQKMIAKNKQALDKLLEEYLDGELPQDRYRKAKGKLEDAMQRHETEVAALSEELEFSSVQEEQVHSLQDYISEVPHLLGVADENEDAKRDFLSRLGVGAVMSAGTSQKHVDWSIFASNKHPSWSRYV